MAEAYCKWPVIAACILGGLILISVIWCLARCLCCGLSCCCTCFSCLKCCGNCCGCCDDPGKKHKHLDEPYFPAAFGNAKQGYQAPGGMHDPTMMSGGAGDAGWGPGQAPAEPFDDGRPKFATFETGPGGLAVEPKVVNEDALPPMPSWGGAQKRKISIENDTSTPAVGAVALDELDPITGQKMPLMSGAGAISRSGSPAVSPFGGQNQFPSSNAALVGGAMAGGAMNGRHTPGQGQGPYRQNSNQSRNGHGNDAYSPNPNVAPYGAGRGTGYPTSQAAPYNPSFPQDQYGSSQTPFDNPYSLNPQNGSNLGWNQDKVESPMSQPQGGAFGVLGGGGGVGNTPYSQSRNLTSGQGQRPYPVERNFSNISSNGLQQQPAGPLDSRDYNHRGFGGDGARDDQYGVARAESPPMLENTSPYPYQQEPQQRQHTGNTASPSYVSRAPTNQCYGGERW